jgi:GTPase SAR1 family protein
MMRKNYSYKGMTSSSHLKPTHSLVMIVGDSGVGKSSFFSMLTKKEVLAHPNPTTRLEFATKMMNKDGNRITSESCLLFFRLTPLASSNLR